jgi:large subunit ribosomal protein L22
MSGTAIEFKACHRYAGIADRKVRRVIDLIRGRTANDALADLQHDRHRAAPMIRKVLSSAVANALQNPAVKASRLVVSQAYVQGGPLLQGRLRFRPGPMGRAMPFRRRTCHIHVRVSDPALRGGDVAGAGEAQATETEATPKARGRKKSAAPEQKPARAKAPRKTKRGADDQSEGS